jgi:CRISPR-associated protein Csm3
MTDIQLYGRIILQAEVAALSGLHIGGSSSGMEIGGVDKAVIRNPLDNRPYIPGSSLRGKMRSQVEKKLGLPQNQRIAQIRIHTCKNEDDYRRNGGCPICHVFGIPAEQDFSGPTRLVVRDIALSDDSAQKLDKANTELRFAELKTEVAIDRVTSAATPRTLERVPAGAVFAPAELVYSVYGADDFQRFKLILEALQLVEDDYLGGGGSRGSGKVRFQNIRLSARSRQDYTQVSNFSNQPLGSIQDLAASFEQVLAWLQRAIPTE